MSLTTRVGCVWGVCNERGPRWAGLWFSKLVNSMNHRSCLDSPVLVTASLLLVRLAAHRMLQHVSVCLNSVIASYFAGTNVIFAVKGHEVEHDEEYNELYSRLTVDPKHAIVHRVKTYTELLTFVKQHYWLWYISNMCVIEDALGAMQLLSDWTLCLLIQLGQLLLVEVLVQCVEPGYDGDGQHVYCPKDQHTYVTEILSGSVSTFLIIVWFSSLFLWWCLAIDCTQ